MLVGLDCMAYIISRLNLQLPSRAGDTGFAGTRFGVAESSARLVGIVRLEIV
ncbi:MAG: hypothetical protein VX628_02880 [Cyanobacteriota bacterium]|nr:hypothetical protein [Cyanobacteriota bacterium]